MEMKDVFFVDRNWRKQMKMKDIFFVEVTDTFGGEANYCWVKRFKVHANTERGAMRKVAKQMGYGGGVKKDWDTGDLSRWNWRSACMCAFVQGYENWYSDSVESI